MITLPLIGQWPDPRSLVVTVEDDAGTRIPRVTLASMVGERIRSSILDGALTPGSQLNEVELANNFGVSRGPVREALQRLIQEGLLRSEPHRGVFVPVMTDEDVEDVYLAREVLETSAVRRIADMGRSTAAFQTLDRVIRAMRKAEETKEWQTLADRDLDFHTELVSACASPRLARMFTTVISETRLCLGLQTGAYASRGDIADEHGRIAELVRDGDTEAAVAMLKKHFEDSVRTLKRPRGAQDHAAEVS
jgi:DNA-binding GntR family transcriptional regulator